MPIIHVDISDETYKVFNKLPKQVKGKFVDLALVHFLKTTEGQAIVGFLLPNGAVTEAATDKQEMLDATQYPNLDDWSE